MTDGRNCCHCFNGNRFLWKLLNAWLTQTGWVRHSLECFVINIAHDFHDNRPCCWNKASVINFPREKKISLCLFSYLHRKHHDISEKTRYISCDQAIFEKQFSTTCLSQSWRTYLISSYYIGFFFFLIFSFFTVREVVATAQGLDAHHWPLAWQILLMQNFIHSLIKV